MLYLGHNIGLSVGQLVGGTIFNNYTKYLFIGNAVTIFLCVILIKFLVKEGTEYNNTESDIDIGVNTEETNIDKNDNKGLFKIIIENKKLIFL